MLVALFVNSPSRVTRNTDDKGVFPTLLEIDAYRNPNLKIKPNTNAKSKTEKTNKQTNKKKQDLRHCVYKYLTRTLAREVPPLSDSVSFLRSS